MTKSSCFRWTNKFQVEEGNGDMGRALITEEKAFDLRPLRDPSQGRIVLHLAGWDSPLEYVYPQ